MREGQGILLITNAVVPATMDEFDAWYLRQHLNERLGIPGFERGRRYRTDLPSTRFMALYETQMPAVLHGEDYMERLANPTPWTQKVMPSFRDTSRSLLRVGATHGVLVGSAIAIIDLTAVIKEESTIAQLRALLPEISVAPGICASHLWLPPDFVPPPTPELKLRDAPDRSVAAVLVIEATGTSSLRSVIEANVARHLPAETVAGAEIYSLLCTMEASAAK
ncbi:MAG: hypothetical protein ABI612_08365 [Betaproteobacteria bacterium]